jgi:hypothetical protein
MADCLKILDQINAGRLDDNELAEILEILQREKRARQAAGALEGLEQALFERGTKLVRDIELAAKIKKRNQLINIVKENYLLTLAERADQAVGDPSLGIEGALVGVNAPFDGSRRSVASIAGALEGEYLGGMIADLKAANLLDQFNSMSGDFEREVARALSDFNMKVRDPNVQANEPAKQIAGIMFKYQRAALQRENAAGAYIKLKDGRVVRASHSPATMTKLGRDQWKNDIRGRLDYEKMDIPIERIDGFLDSAYDAITSGVRLDGARSEEMFEFTGPQNLAKLRSRSSVFIFKSADDWFDYDQKYGRASLREAFIEDLRNSARSTAMMENFGTNPRAMFERVTDKLKQKHRTDAKKLSRLERKNAVVNFEAAFAEVSGESDFGVDTPLAQWMGGIRALQTMSKLGGAWIASLTDIAFNAANRQYQGRSMLDAWGDALKTPFRGMSRGQMRDLADRMGVGLEGTLGEFHSRFNPADDAPGKISKLQQLFFKLNLLGPWSDANKRGASLIIANDLGRESGKAFGELGEDLQRLLRIYGIDEKGWETARKNAQKGPDGRDYLVPGGIEDARVRESLFALITSEADFAVPSAGARERSIMKRGYRPDTVAGQALRFVFQFKSFGVTALSKVLGRQVYGYGAKTFREQLMRGAGANMGLVSSVIGTTVLGYFVIQLKELAKGREPREPSAELFIASALQGGGLGIYGDYLFGQVNRFGGGPLETLAGPTVGTVNDLVSLLQRARDVATGEDEDLSGDVIRLLKSNTPFANLFYTQEAMNYLLWYQLQEMTNPGYLRRMERRVQRENEQTYWLPPSSVVQMGGGFR